MFCEDEKEFGRQFRQKWIRGPFFHAQAFVWFTDVKGVAVCRKNKKRDKGKNYL